MPSDFATGYLVGQTDLISQQADQRLLDRLVQRHSPASPAITAWQQQCAALEGKVAILRAEVDKLVAENARLRGVIDLGDVAINDAVALANKLQAELAEALTKALKREVLIDQTQRLLNEARAVTDPI